MIYPFKMVIFHSHVSLPEGTQYEHVSTLGTSWYSVVHRVDGATRMRPPSQWRRGPLRWKNLGNDWGNTSEGWSCLCGVDFFVGHFLRVYIICSKLFEYVLTCFDIFNHPAKMVTDPHFWQEILYRISKDMFKTWKTSPARALFLLI